MKKLIVMMVLGVCFTSCVETKSVEDPNKELFEVFEKQKSEGVQYFKFKDKFYTETQFDSINEVLNKKITEEMIKELDGVSIE